MGTVKGDIFSWMETIMLANSKMVKCMAGENSEMYLIPQFKLETGDKVNFCDIINSILYFKQKFIYLGIILM